MIARTYRILRITEILGHGKIMTLFDPSIERGRATEIDVPLPSDSELKLGDYVDVTVSATKKAKAE